jgi:nucleoside-diphosphate-sugar epimerase
MRIFITGSTGFIGKHVLNNLSKNPENRILALSMERGVLTKNNKNLEIIDGSLEELNHWSKKVREFNPDVCIHLAWYGIPDHGHEPSLKNLQNSLKLFLFLKEIKCKKIIVPGSCFEYGIKQGVLNETEPPRPTDPFTASKTSILLMGQDIFKNTETKFIWARLFYVYGPGQRDASLIPSIVGSIRQGQIPDIRKPDARNDFVYVEDVANAINKLVLNPVESGIYNVGSGETTSIREIISLVYKISKIKEPIIEAKGGDNVDFKADISKIKKAINWTPQTKINAGIEKYLNNKSEGF